MHTMQNLIEGKILLCFLRASSIRDGRSFLGRDFRKKNIIIKVGGNIIKLEISPTAIYRE